MRMGDTGETLRQVLELPQGRFVFREGDMGSEMYVIHEGRVEILQDHAGRQDVLAVLEKGDTFGELSMLDHLPRTVSARALSAVKLIRLDGATFYSMLRESPETAERLLGGIARRARMAHQLVREDRGERSDGSGGQARSETAPVGISRLVHDESGTVFAVLLDRISAVGRRDAASGILPEIDLGLVDPDRTTSRQHARIIPEQGRFLLIENAGAANGTFLNGTRIESGIPVEIRSGDALRFGLVECSFHTD